MLCRQNQSAYGQCNPLIFGFSGCLTAKRKEKLQTLRRMHTSCFTMHTSSSLLMPLAEVSPASAPSVHRNTTERARFPERALRGQDSGGRPREDILGTNRVARETSSEPHSRRPPYVSPLHSAVISLSGRHGLTFVKHITDKYIHYLKPEVKTNELLYRQYAHTIPP